MLYSDKQVLLNNSRNPIRLKKIREKLCLSNGGLFEGQLPDYEWAIENLGEQFNKVILASKNIEKLCLGSYTVLGGWCVLRTKCMQDLRSGIITDPKTGEKKQYETIEEVCQWLEKAIALDQIIETVGSYNGDLYVAISEEHLWSEKIIKAVAKKLNKKFTAHESEQIVKAIRFSEEKRARATEKYLSFVKGKKIRITKVRDSLIFQDLVKARNDLYNHFGITNEKLLQPVIKRRLSRDLEQSQDQITDLFIHMDRYSLVLLMYTGYYLNILKEKGYVKTENAIIIEPYSHTRSNESDSEFRRILLSEEKGAHNYLVKGGINEHLGFIVLDEISDYGLHKFSKLKTIAEVPNIKNYFEHLKSISESNTISILDLKKNTAFLAGINYLPYGECGKALERMITISNGYFKKTQELNGNSKKNTDYYVFKKQKSELIREQSLIVLRELSRMMSYVFNP